MELVWLVLVIFIAWFWLDSLHVRELAITAGRRAAEHCELQLLDESVACSKLWFARDQEGRMRCLRTFNFEVTDTGSERLACSLTLLGNRVDKIDMPPYHDNVVQLH